MTQPSFQRSPDSPYQSAGANRNAPTLIKLAVIFNFIMAAIDLVYGMFLVVMAIIVAVAPDAPPDPDAPPRWVVVLIIAGVTIFPIIAAALKFIAGMKLHRHGKNAAGWGLAAGILGCLQFWCVYFCALPLACGIFTIIVCSLGTVRAYLRDPLATLPQNTPPQNP